MQRNWIKRIKRIIFIGVPLGVLCGILQVGLDIDKDTFLKYYIYIGIFIILVAIAFNYIYNMVMQKKIISITEKLLDGVDVEVNIAKLKDLYQKCHSGFCKNIININLAVVYSDKKQYRTALEFLEQVHVEKLPKLLKAIYYIDSAYFHWMLGNPEIAKRVWDENQKLLEKFKDHKMLRFSFKINDAYGYATSGEMDLVVNALEQAKELCSNKREEQEYQLAVKNLL